MCVFILLNHEEMVDAFFNEEDAKKELEKILSSGYMYPEKARKHFSIRKMYVH